MIARVLKRLLAAVVLLVVVLALLLRVRYGGGTTDFPDRSGTPSMPETALEVVADLPTPPGNVAVSAGGRVFVTLHPEARPKVKVAELVDGQMRPFPNAAFQSGDGEPRHFREVLSLRIDRDNRLWTLDTGGHGVHPGRLLAFDLADGKVVHDFEFPRDVAGLGSHLNDFQVAPDGAFVYIAEASFFARTPALVVYDVRNRSARRVLQQHASVTPENYIPVVQGQAQRIFGLVSIRPGVDSIALDKRGEWLYFAPVTSNHLYRVRASDLQDAALSPAALGGRVETYAEKTMSDGITIDAADNIYISDLEHSAILRLTPERRLDTLLATPKLRWPDGFSFGPDGWLYVTCSSLHQVFGRLPGQVARSGPFQVFRFRPGTESVPGH